MLWKTVRRLFKILNIRIIISGNSTSGYIPSGSERTCIDGNYLLNCSKKIKPIFKNEVSIKQSFKWISSVTQLCLTLRSHGLQHTRPPCPSPTPRACSNSYPSGRWCHPTISSSVVPVSSSLQSCPASGSFPLSQFFTSGGQSIGASASASFLPMNIQDWIPLGWTGWISLQSKGLSRVFSNTTVQKHRFFSTQLSF